MAFSSRKEHHLSPPPADGLASQSAQRPWPVCTWSAHTPQSRPSPFPRSDHTLTATATATGEFLLFGGWVHGCARNDLYMFSTRDFSTTLLQTSGEVPSPRFAHGAALIGTTLLIYGGRPDFENQNVLDHDSLYLLNPGTSDLLMSSPTSADHIFAPQNHESGLALWSMVLGPILVSIKPQPWSVPSSSSSVVRSAGRFSVIYGHSI
jgi:hypothetical protein